jgi:hypothetical protein
MKKEIFSVESANILITDLKIYVDEFRVNYKSLVSIRKETERLEKDSDVMLKQERLFELFNTAKMLDNNLSGIIRDIENLGIIIQDPYRGLFDFLSTYKGQAIYLCWEYGEAKISMWHYLDTGFAGRIPIIGNESFPS